MAQGYQTNRLLAALPPETFAVLERGLRSISLADDLLRAIGPDLADNHH
jgi:hypothetical protein